MTQEEIIRMARDAGMNDAEYWLPDDMAQMERFAALVAAYERELCAKVCEETKAPKIRDEWSAGQMTGCSSCAAAIRARGEK